MGWSGYASGSADGNMVVDILDSGTFNPEGSAKDPPSGVGGKDELCCVPCIEGTPNVPRLVLEDVGVRPGTASKKSEFEGAEELYAGSKPKLARCVDEIGKAWPCAVRFASGTLSGKVLARRGPMKSSCFRKFGRVPRD